MGNLLSFDDEMDGELNGAVAREQLQQRQRAQVLLLSQLRQEGGGPAALGLRPMQQPSLRQTQVFKNPLHVRAKSVQLSCTSQSEGQESEQWQLSFIFDALVPCEVLVHVGRCGVEVRQSLHAAGEAPSADVVVSETGCGEYRWVSSPVQFREGLNQEFRGAIELGEFASSAEAQPENTLDTFAEGLRPRSRTQGFCIELKAVKTRRSIRDTSPSRPRSRSQSFEGPTRRPSQEETTMIKNEDASQGLAAEWTIGRFVRRDCNQVAMEMAENPGEVVEAKILSQSVKLPENSDNALAPCYSMFEVYGADPSESGIGAECAICMSERRDTAVLPCRHMCLCSGCAETMRTQIQYHSYRCPICRERVSSLLQKRPELP